MRTGSKAGLLISIFSAAITASFVGFGGTVALVVEAARTVNATQTQIASWIATLCFGIAVTTLYLSLRHHLPIITAWSTPGAALVASSAKGLNLAEAVGAFTVAGGLILLVAAIRPLGRLIERIPAAIASAMLAGVLVHFCLEVTNVAQTSPLFVLPLVATFFLVKLWKASLAVFLTFAVGLILAAVGGLVQSNCCDIKPTIITRIVPIFDLPSIIGLGLPLFLVTMASQNLPGIAVLKAAGYSPPTRSSFAVTGFASLLLAPFGAHGINLAAITAAICTGPSCHPNPDRRWIAGLVYAACYLVLAAFASSFVDLLKALPASLVTTIAGLALFGPLQGALQGALAGDGHQNEAAVLTFLVAASGANFVGVGSAFWGLAVGLIFLSISHIYQRSKTS
ncbi:putative Benzoate membrane transport protein [Scytonema sp. HK-05]|uniref:benzoate/H(+) symporter BenE family transporter n=1 Tax=Scytonema sp. HK-05 TaxID=1137095 RepID=UPI0009363EE4|nr:benzoate/H(+) symporter BenE family transporter [Scytonema sp. HK-05]OKH56764.1 hypothetical protein NIES2130_23410 [Scytonema sp. HK-05]BAY44938.1 putative Benzoate membrane transport protein [Scytonema sp. HK-05]